MEELEARCKPHTELRCNCWIPSWELPSIVNHVQELSYMFQPQSRLEIMEVITPPGRELKWLLVIQRTVRKSYDISGDSLLATENTSNALLAIQ